MDGRLLRGSGRNGVMVALVVLTLAAAGVMFGRTFFKSDAGGEGMDRLMHFQCRAEGCGRQFALTYAQHRDKTRNTPDGAVACPDCGKYDTFRGPLCPECNKVLETIGHGRLPNDCPHCGHHFGDWIPVPEEAERGG